MYLQPNDPFVARLCAAVGYRGKKVQVKVHEGEVSLSGTYWDGGSRSSYYAVRLDTLQQISLPHFSPPQFGGPREDPKVPIPDGGAIIEHSMFQGKDMGLRIMVRAESAAKLLPAPVELSADERFTLSYISGHKASYNGMNRRERACRERPYITRPDGSWGQGEPAITPERWDAAVVSLKTRKLLNAAGAITVDGRNAIAK